MNDQKREEKRRMEKRIDELIKRYYQGETSIEEERILKAAFHAGSLPDDPVLAYQDNSAIMPEGLMEKIQSNIHHKHHLKLRYRILTLSGIAAMLLLVVSIRSLLPRQETLQLSDNLKKERFEEALRVIGNVIDEKNPPIQKVLYEDSRLIIAVE